MQPETIKAYQRLVRFGDTDAAGVVYFANVLIFCHEAYEDALLGLGICLPRIPAYPDLALPIVHSAVDFFRPLACGDFLEIKLSPRSLDPTSYEIHYHVKVQSAPKLAAQALTRHVCIDRQTRTRCELPPILQTWITAAESPGPFGDQKDADPA